MLYVPGVATPQSPVRYGGPDYTLAVAAILCGTVELFNLLSQPEPSRLRYGVRPTGYQIRYNITSTYLRAVTRPVALDVETLRYHCARRPWTESGVERAACNQRVQELHEELALFAGLFVLTGSGEGQYRPGCLRPRATL